MRIVILFLCLLVKVFFGTGIYSQDELPAKPGIDTLVYRGGGVTPVIIDKVTASTVFYSVPGDNTFNEVDRQHIERIIYSNGEVEVLNKPVFQLISDDDWRHVFISDDPDEADGMYLLGPVQVTAPAGRNRNLTVRNAERRLKRQGAAINARLIVITGTEFRGGYGDVPSIIMRGMAYGTGAAD
ncbi:MAG: hypothetical protein R6U58_09700 [Bacteroidales bacterium]